MIYFTSDLHFNHDREFIWGPRGFKSIDEMNETLFRNWNETVGKNDTIYVLGDFFLGPVNAQFIHHMITELNGEIHFVRGNHDTPAKMKIYNEDSLVNVEGYATMISYTDVLEKKKTRQFYLSHFPTMTATLTSNPDNAIYNLFGHTHSKEKFYEGRPYMYNVAVDAHNNRPVSIDEIMKDIDNEIAKCWAALGN